MSEIRTMAEAIRIQNMRDGFRRCACEPLRGVPLVRVRALVAAVAELVQSASPAHAVSGQEIEASGFDHLAAAFVAGPDVLGIAGAPQSARLLADRG